MSVRPLSAFRLLVVLTTLALGVVVGSPAVAGADTGPSTWTVLVGSQSPNSAISGMKFLPGTITIDAGDTVHWVANSVELHTVTFLAGGQALPTFNPGDPTQNTAQGGSVYDGSSYYNSGVMTTVPDGEDAGPIPPVPHVASYDLTFPDAGTYTYYCLVHGVAMVGVVNVNPAGTVYPQTQAQVDHQAQLEANAIVTDGNRLRAETNRMAGPDTVMVGNDDMYGAMLMRFVHQTVTVRAGDSVTFTNPGMGPHTVTFGQEPEGPALENYVPAATYDGTVGVSSFLPGKLSFTVTFTKPGRYHYICALHDVQGMTGTVIVRR